MTSASSTNGSRPHPQAGRLVPVSALVAALRRRWRLWVCGAAAAAFGAAALSIASPPEHTATTVLLLQQPSGSDKSSAMLTDARLVESRTVAQAVVDHLGLQIKAQRLVDQYRPTILSDDLLQIRVSGPTDREAVRRAEALAQQFLNLRRDEIQRQSTVAVQNLEERQLRLNTELLAVNEAINARTGAQGKEELNAFGDLLARQRSITESLGSVRQRIELATFDTDSIFEKSRVVDPAAEDERSPLRGAVFNIVAGTILGLLVTGGWVVLQEATTDRPRRRDDVAIALGAPIGANIDRLRGPVRLQRRRFKKLLAHPPLGLARAVDHVRASLYRSEAETPALVLVSIQSDGAAALALAATAVRLIQEGRSVLVVDLTRRNILARLTKVRPDRPDRLPLVGSATAVWVSFPPHRVPRFEGMKGSDATRELASEVDTILALATVTPALGASHLAGVADRAVAVASAGRTSETGLRSIAQIMDVAGLPLSSVVMVGPDEGDESAGLLRSRPAPVPAATRVATRS